MQNKNEKYVLAFGNPVYDVISTPVLRRTDRVLSGCSTNACLALSKMGERSTLVGTVGEDFADRLRQDLNHYKIGSYLFPSPQTGGFSLIYDHRGDRELSILGIANPIPGIPNELGKPDFVLLGPILGEVSPELVRQIKENTYAQVLLDPQGLLRQVDQGNVVHRLTTEFKIIAGLSTIIKANELETEVVTGINPRKHPEDAVQALHQYGAQIAVVTLAEAGSIIYDGSRIVNIPPYVTDAIDPTGAGDTYAAGFMLKYLETPEDLSAVGCFASAVASVMVENSGPDFPLTRSEADRRADILLSSPQKLKLT
jgi:sugar/nucleoside kinase (ribokinase family)